MRNCIKINAQEQERNYKKQGENHLDEKNFLEKIKRKKKEETYYEDFNMFSVRTVERRIPCVKIQRTQFQFQREAREGKYGAEDEDKHRAAEKATNIGGLQGVPCQGKPSTFFSWCTAKL